MKITGIAASLLLLTGMALAADAPAPPVRTNLTVTGQRIVVPIEPDVVFTTTVLAPGAKLPVHKHPYPHFVYVMSGTLTLVIVETNKTYVLPAGSFVVEPLNTWHYGVNDGTAPLTVVTTDQVPHGYPKNVILKNP